MATPSSLIPDAIPFVILGGFILVIIINLRRFVKIIKYAKELRAKIANGSFPKEQFQELDKHIKEKGGLQRDLFSANKWYERTGFELYLSPEDQLPSATTDARFYLSISGVGSGVLRRLICSSATKTIKDDVSMTVLDGVFTVGLNGKDVGVVDLLGKMILDINKKRVAEIISPPYIYFSGIGSFRKEISWKVVFSEGKEAKLISQKGNINPLNLANHTPVVELSPGLSKEERALVLGVYTFLKVQRLLNRNNYN